MQEERKCEVRGVVVGDGEVVVGIERHDEFERETC